MKRNAWLTLVASFAIIFGASTLARAENAVIVPLDGAPLKILGYVAEFDTKDDKPRVEHTVKYQNVTQMKILAARFGFLEYSGFGERLDNFTGSTLEDSSKGEKDSVEFVNAAPHAFCFEKFGSAYVWVDAVRYADGTVWKADRAQLLEGLKKLNPAIVEADLAVQKNLGED